MPVFLSVVGPTGGADGRTLCCRGRTARNSKWPFSVAAGDVEIYLRRPSHPYAAPYHEGGRHVGAASCGTGRAAQPPLLSTAVRLLHGEERAVVAAAADTLYYNKVVEAEPWMRASELFAYGGLRVRGLL